MSLFFFYCNAFINFFNTLCYLSATMYVWLKRVAIILNLRLRVPPPQLVVLGDFSEQGETTPEEPDLSEEISLDRQAEPAVCRTQLQWSPCWQNQHVQNTTRPCFPLSLRSHNWWEPLVAYAQDTSDQFFIQDVLDNQPTRGSLFYMRLNIISWFHSR